MIGHIPLTYPEPSMALPSNHTRPLAAPAICLKSFLLLLGLAVAGPLWAQDTDVPDPVENDEDEFFHERFTAEGVQPWEEYSKFIQARSTLSTQGPQLFGDDVNLYNGALSFAVTDIDLPGNSALPVQLRRVMAVGEDANDAIDPSLGGWGLDLPNVSGVYGTTWPATRCSNPNPPTVLLPGNTSYSADDYWQGLHANLPSGGGELLSGDSKADRPPTGGPYQWVTPGFTWFSCLTSIQNGAGEGFLAITADGTKYWFNWMAQFSVTPLKQPMIWNPSASPLQRKRNTLYVTRVEDRFGNYVTYTYSNAWNEPVRLQSIVANDDRQITVSYTGGRLRTATASGYSRPWTYHYDGDNWLTGLTLPDFSNWSFNIKNLVTAKIQYAHNDGQSYCTNPAHPLHPNQQFTGSITHPSGAQATFAVGPTQQGRSKVPMICVNHGTGAPQSAQTPRHQNNHYGLAIKQKTVEGPGLPQMNWNYQYSPNYSWACAVTPGGPPGLSNCPTPLPAAGFCQDESCATGRSTTIVQGPDEWTRYRFGNTYLYDEGQLRTVDKGTSVSQILETETTTYNLAQSGQPYPTPIGISRRSRGDGFLGQFLKPRRSHQIARPQQATTFTWQVPTGCHTNSALLCFDTFARPTRVTKSGTSSKTEVTVYHDNPSLWVLGQVASVRAGTGAFDPFIEQTTFDPTTAQPTHRYAFGKLMERRTYYPKVLLSVQGGLPHEIYDGSNLKKTTLSDYHRGVPQLVEFHDKTEQSAVVNDRGDITSITDERGYSTTYGYDHMGRINQIVYPTLDQTTWSNTTLTFQRIDNCAGNDCRGLPAGHWQLHRTTGAHRHITWFDGLWRPVLTREYDAGNEAATQRMTSRGYNHRGQEIRASYPQPNIALFNLLTNRIETEYDAIGRPTLRKASSELGWLTTNYAYLTLFRTRVTDPNGNATTTSFQAFDQPVTDFPTTIQHPLSVTTTIVRDPWGKPTSITRAGTWQGSAQSAVRRFVYDGHQRLCKTLDPETAATLQGWDDSGNVAWTATGITAPSTTDCQHANAPAAQRSVRSYNARNRVTLIDHPAGTPDTSFTYHPNGQLWTTANDGSTWTYGYDKRGFLRSETLAIDGLTFGFTHGYTNLGHRASLQYPDGTSLNYLPNALGQPTRAGSYATNATWHPNGAVAGFTYGNALTHSQTLNTRQLPFRLIDSGILQYDLYWDGNANLSDLVGTGLASTASGTFTYDALDRLTRVHNKPASNPNPEENYAYDALDHLRQTRFGTSPDPVLVFDYAIQAASNRLSQISVSKGANSYPQYVFGYDTRGNMTLRGVGGDHSHAYDAANRMLWANTGSQENYRYDGHGRRTRINRPSQGHTYQVYGIDGKFLYERAPSGTITKHVYLGKRRVASLEGSTVRYHHLDHLGSVVGTSNAAGTVTASESYASYGSTWDGTYSQGPGFTGHVTDAASGLSYMQQRYYDPVAMRFVSPDPVYVDTASGGNFNRYWYANNNPYKYVDPDGQLSRCGVSCDYERGDFRRTLDEGLQSSHYSTQSGGERNQTADQDASRGSHRNSEVRPPLYCSGGAGCDFMYNQEQFLSRLISAEEFLARTQAQGVGGMAGAVSFVGIYTGGVFWNSQFRSDFVRAGPTVVSNQLIYGPGVPGATVTWAIKGGGGKLPFHYHIHRYNWNTPWHWFRSTPIIKPSK